MTSLLEIESLHKTFILHTQNGSLLEVLHDVSFNVDAGEVVALCGPSGAGKSSVLKAIYGTYCATGGRIWIRSGEDWIDVAAGDARDIQLLRRSSVGYVSQFLRVVPRVPSLEVVAEPAIEAGTEAEVARSRAREILDRLSIPSRLHRLSPLTFSGGEQQRVNIARAMCAPKPIMLFDEPTASLDARNREVVLEMIGELRTAGHAVVAIFHDANERRKLGAREIEIAAGMELQDA